MEADECVELLVSDISRSENLDQSACAKGEQQGGLRKDGEEVILGTLARQRDGRCNEAED